MHRHRVSPVKGLYQHLGAEAWGHSVKRLVEELANVLESGPLSPLVDCGRFLDRLYIPTRYPNGFDYGKSADYYTAKDAQEAIRCAEEILRFCADHISR